MLTYQNFGSYVLGVAFQPTKNLLASCSADKTIKTWDITSGSCLSTLRGHTDTVWSVCFSPCGEKIASGGGDQYGNKDYSIRIWDAKTGEQIGSPLRGHTDPVSSVCFSPDGAKIVSGSWDKKVLIWDAASGEQLRSLRGHSDVVRSVCFSSDGKKLTSGSEDSTVRNWNPATRASLS